MLFQVHEAEACLPSPGVGGVHGGSRLLGPAAADAEGVVLGRGRGRKREHFKLGVVFMIACVENSLFWSRAAAGRAKLLPPPAAARSTPRMGDDSQRIALGNVTFMMKCKHQQAVSNATISSHCFRRQDSLAEQRPLGCYFVAHLLSLESDVEVS